MSQLTLKTGQHLRIGHDLRSLSECEQLRVASMCVDSGTNTLYIAFNVCGRQRELYALNCFVNAISLSTGQTVQQSVYFSEAACGYEAFRWINGLGFVSRSGTLLVYSNVPNKHTCLTFSITFVGKSGEGKWSEWSEWQWSPRQRRFRELSDARVISGADGDWQDEAHQMIAFKVNASHNIDWVQQIKTPHKYCAFDARDVADLTFVALAHYSQKTVCVYELLPNNRLEKRYRLSVGSRECPIHVLWCGDRLLAATPHELVALSRSPNTSDALAYSAALRTEDDDLYRRSATMSPVWKYYCAGDRVMEHNYEAEAENNVEHLWIYSLDDVPTIELPRIKSIPK